MTEEAAEQPVVEASNVSLGYSRRAVVHDVNLTVLPGERWFVVGPNGQGKTTLVRGILGLLPPLSGTFARDDQRMSPSNLGFVPQSCAVSRSLPITVREFVSLGTVGLKLARAVRRERVLESLGQVGLSDRIDADFWSLSGGQQQRTLLARALARRPKVLVLDEPAAGLDLAAEQSLMDILTSLHRESDLTTLLVTHNIEVVARFASHVALVNDGEVIAGPRDEILSSERLKCAFGVPVRIDFVGFGTATIHVGSDEPADVNGNPS